MISSLIDKFTDSKGNNIYTSDDLSFCTSLANELQALKLDQQSIITGFLIRANSGDSKIRERIASEFGLDYINRIELLQRIGRITFPDTQKKIQDLRKLFVELSDDLSIIFVKLSERLLSLKYSDQRKASDLVKLSEECLYLYSPIAHRLGIRKIYTEMEDIAFKNLYPDIFRKLQKEVERKRPHFEKKLKEMSYDLVSKLAKDNINVTVQKRVKRLYSIYLKIKNKMVDLDEIFDLMALRVITDSVESCYLSLGIIHRNWIPIEGRFRDWVAFPKSNGYRSIQTTISTRSGDRFEIQIRTNEMHYEAEFGSSAHWAYKEGLNASDSWILKLREFLENDMYFENPALLNDMLKSEVKRDHINVLTPKGEIVSLPENSTAIDFAYAIHSQLGNQVLGAKVNGKIIKLKVPLKSGDVVEIIANKNGKPSRDWLSFVKTSKARSKIQLWLKKNETEQIVVDGKRSWERFKKEHRRKLSGYDDEQVFKQNLSAIGFKSTEDFYSAISMQSVKCSVTLLRKLYPLAFKKALQKTDGLKSRERLDTMGPGIIVEGQDSIQFRLSKCCNPIKGEPILAYVTKGSIIKIHSTECKFIKSDTLEADRLKTAEWIDKGSLQTVKLRIIGLDYNEMLNSLVDVTKELGINIISSERLTTRDKSINISFEIEIKDINHLNTFRQKLSLKRSIVSIKQL